MNCQAEMAKIEPMTTPIVTFSLSKGLFIYEKFGEERE